MNTTQKLRKIARNFAREKLLPFIPQNVKFFIALSGSVGYGFADEFSDIEMEIYVEDKIVERKIRKIIKKEKEYSGKEISAGITGWPVKELLTRKFKIDTTKNPYLYFELKN